jgi:streptomycin 6-kinase
MAASTEKLHKGLALLQHAKSAWQLLDDGDYFLTGNSLLQPVLFERRPAMLKVPLSGKGSTGFRLLDCWAGKAAVNVYKYDANALLMERAIGERSLRRIVLDGREDEANTIVCGVVQQLHAHACTEPPALPSLASWFQSLATAATLHSGVFLTCHTFAETLLRNPRDIVALHGDIHYDNILDAGRNIDIHDDKIPDSGHRGWLAIDAKGVIGERAFDYANLFCNPSFEVATSPTRLPRAIPLVAARAGLEPRRLLRWIIAWSGLMAAWMLEDGEEPTLPLLVAKLSVFELENS